MSGRSTNTEHNRRIKEIKYLIDTGCSTQVAELIMSARYKVSREASRNYRIKAEAIKTEPLTQEQINYSSSMNRLSIAIDNTLHDYSVADDPETKDIYGRNLDRLVKSLERLSNLANIFIIDAKY
tara:strand:+ start:43 stop:417 length:375 start_codon:yes stop_codon:yes gene_type:complete